MSQCPFHSSTGNVSLAELPGVVRCGDRLRLRKALKQLSEALQATNDLDEARGQALTFVAVVCSATLEMGGPRATHMVQLEVARKLDQLESIEEITELCRDTVEHVCEPLFVASEDPSKLLIEKTLRTIDRQYADDLTDSKCAADLGLSTSHFRYLFREVTGQPFGRYLTSVRLEKGRKLLMEGMSVSDVAAAVGFQGLAHFSRAFTQRFRVNPSFLRRGLLKANSERS